ncbi:MAG: pantoate--beta-alanine ligase [Desulfonatronovibrionaceae bacterium]
MEIISDPGKMNEWAAQHRDKGLISALVPTMGYFHDGHLSLMRWARDNADLVVVSLFVNPSQFGPGEDLEQYPRDMDRDSCLAESCGVDCLFTPQAGDMYPDGYGTWIQVPELSRQLCGSTRPHHFTGVCTIVCKLLNIVRPDLAVFGEKDRQQLLIISKMVRDLNMPVKILGRPTLREHDGLAMSSRNCYLNPVQRAQALFIHKGLLMVRDRVLAGERDARNLEREISEFYARNMPDADTEYAVITHETTLQPAAKAGPGTFLAVAVRLGQARLIDNMKLDRSGKS